MEVGVETSKETARRHSKNFQKKKFSEKKFSKKNFLKKNFQKKNFQKKIFRKNKNDKKFSGKIKMMNGKLKFI